MMEREIRKMGRQDLLILLEDQSVKIQKLEEQLKEAEQKIQEKTLVFENCGTMAEAAIQVNNVFKAADAAAHQYLESIREMQEKQAIVCTLIEEARVESEKIIQEAKTYATHKKNKTDEMIRQAEETAAKELAKIDERWEEIYRRICSMGDEYAWIRGMISDLYGMKE